MIQFKEPAIKKICIIAGEASGDLHGASLVKVLRQSGEPMALFGLGGPLLRELGVEMVYPPPLNVVGFTEVVFKIFHLWKAYQTVKEALRDRKPDLIILIDYPDMNLRLATAAHKEKIPVLYYISPQVWAWRSGRVKNIARDVDRMAVILPFEVEFYKSFGVPVEFVGHPLLDRMESSFPEGVARFPVNHQERALIGLLPGSRPTEIKTILPVLLETAFQLTRRFGAKVQFVLPVANTLDSRTIQEKIRPYQDRGVLIELATGDSLKTLARCRQAIVASGTVTLEAAILGIPILIVYKVTPVNYWIARHLIDVPFVGLVNWVAGKKIIPEYIQGEAVPEAIIEGSIQYLENAEYYQNTREELLVVRNKLGASGASRRVAQMALEMIN
ncbi:MAG: lipid-A-disaccharide synthase [Deltaproteobacteria bacterium]|nr:lipid-A-disaccharide synthase [Deltaproteobacteria bacterium]